MNNYFCAKLLSNVVLKGKFLVLKDLGDRPFFSPSFELTFGLLYSLHDFGSWVM